MDRIKMLQRVLIVFVAAIIISGSIWGMMRYLREQDSRWQAAKIIYRIQTALQTLDEDWKLESLLEVHPYEIKRPEGPSIFYYCCVTSYIDEEPGIVSGLNKVALSQVVDVDKLEKPSIWTVNGRPAILGEIDDKMYLCWTISPLYSCVLEYNAGIIPQEEVLHIAESVDLPEK